MKRDSVAALLLIVASVVSLLTLLRHPTNLLSAGDQFESQARLAVWVHAIVIAMGLATFVGLLGLTKRIGPVRGHGLAIAAQVVYGFAIVCLTIAAAVSGFAGTMLARRYVGAAEADRHFLHEMFHYNGM